MASWPSAKVHAQTITKGSASYLLVIETSRAMQPRAKAVYDSVKEILDSNFKGQLREDDKFGIWTFNDALDTSYMPFTPWSPETHLTSAMRAGRFAQPDAYGNRSNLEKITPELNRLLLQPGSVTILLYTTGKNEIHGTALDDQINATYKQWQDQQQKANMPVVTLLCAQDGKITHWSVTPAPWPFELPARIPASQLAQAHAAALQIARSTVEPSTPPATIDLAPDAKSESKESPPARSQQPTATQPEVKLSAPSPQPLIISAAETDPKNASSSQQSVPASASKTDHKEIDTFAPPPAVVQENSAPASVAPAQNEATTPDSPFFVYRRAPRKNVEQSTPNNLVTAQLIPVASQSATPAEPKSEEASSSAIATAAKMEATQPVRARALDPMPTPETASVAPPPAPAPKKSPIQSAAVTPGKSLFSENLIWLVCLALIGIVTAYCFLLWLSSYRRPAIPALTLHDIVERSTPPSPVPVRRANLPAEKTFPASKAPVEPDSTTVQE